MQDIKLPEELRGIFKKPFGELFRGTGLAPAQEIKARLKNEKLIVVGDATLRNILAVGIKPNLAIVDLRTKRETCTAALSSNVLRVRNPAGMITRELWEKIGEALEKESAAILVEGEEDLAVLPAIIQADWESVVLYGQPDEGIVMVRATQEKKEEAVAILKLLMSKGGKA